MFASLKRRKQQKTRGLALYRACVAQARSPGFYAVIGVPDTVDGRFELISLHAALLMRRLTSDGEDGKGVAQDVFDAMFRDLDSALREMAIGDTSVGKQIKAMAEGFYGRAQAYQPGLDASDAAVLSTALKRNVFVDSDGDGDPAALAQYVLDAQERLTAQPGDALKFSADPDFPPAPVVPGA